MHKEKGHEHKETHKRHKEHHEHVKHEQHNSKSTIEEQTIHNLIELQKVHVNLAERFDKLAVQIESLLALFELAARNFAKQPQMQNVEKDKEFLEKIDKLLDQNKLLAKGLSLMEEKMREKIYGTASASMNTSPPVRPSFRQPGHPGSQAQQGGTQEI